MHHFCLVLIWTKPERTVGSCSIALLHLEVVNAFSELALFYVFVYLCSTEGEFICSIHHRHKAIISSYHLFGFIKYIKGPALYLCL